MLKLDLLLAAQLVRADITIHISDVSPIPLDTSAAATSPTDLFHRSCPEEFAESLPYTPEILFSSHSSNSSSFFDGVGYPSSGSFIRGAIEAWAKHQHLVLRPDEVWFEILVQLNFYMSRNAERVRHLVVDHAEKEEILAEGMAWDGIIEGFGEEIQSRVKIPWLLPTFTTTTPSDKLTATVLLMGITQHYFNYEALLICGIPRVTLLGVRDDWVLLLNKLDDLPKLGSEPAAYAENLRPILRRFVKSWDEAESEEVRSFWGQIVRAEKAWACGEGGEWDVSGWITGFLHWRKEGEVRVFKDFYDEDEDEDPISYEGSFTLDNISYSPLSLSEIPISYAKAPLLLNDGDRKTQAYLLTGNIGVRRTEEGEVVATPLSGWCVYAPVRWEVETGPWFGDGMEGIGEFLGRGEL